MVASERFLNNGMPGAIRMLEGERHAPRRLSRAPPTRREHQLLSTAGRAWRIEAAKWSDEALCGALLGRWGARNHIVDHDYLDIQDEEAHFNVDDSQAVLEPMGSCLRRLWQLRRCKSMLWTVRSAAQTFRIY